MTVTNNIIFKTDGYKPSHWLQYPPKTKHVYSYIEARSGRFKEVVAFGLQSIIKKHLEGCQVTPEKIKEAKEFYSVYFKNEKIFNVDGWNYILNKYKGFLPIEIKAIPEGSVIPPSNVLVTVINTDPNLFWLTNYIETVMMQLWYPITVATLSRHIKKIIKKYLEETMDNKELIDLILPWKLHDFGFRGVSSMESSEIGGAAHLINFQGTDTISAILFAKHFYNADTSIFGSIPAAEHSTITSWGQENEEKAIKNMLDKFPDGYVAIVSDSFNIFNVCENMLGKTLKNQILGRKGVVVCRPDSGKIPDIITTVLGTLGNKFGYSTNSLGFKILPPQIRIIQGDGVNDYSIEEILYSMKKYGWSAENITFGMGGALLQKVDRDTLGFAMKCSYIETEDGSREVFKDPITDIGKKSKRGKLKLIKENNTFSTTKIDDPREDCLETVFLNGHLIKEETFENIRKKASI